MPSQKKTRLLQNHVLLPKLWKQFHKGAGVAADVGRKAETANLVRAEGECGPEVSHYAVGLCGGYLPNAEEAQHMVDAIGVEIAFHVGKATFPPVGAKSRFFMEFTMDYKEVRK